MEFNKNLFYKKFVTPFAKAETTYINERSDGIFKDFALSNTRCKHSVLAPKELADHLTDRGLMK